MLITAVLVAVGGAIGALGIANPHRRAGAPTT
jgi:hypothetical protein